MQELKNYIGTLDVQKITAQNWKLLNNFGYQDVQVGTIIVPKDTITDFASLPWIAQVAGFAKSDLYDWAAVIHDYLYTEQLFSQKECDAVFYRACLDCGVPAYEAKIMYSQLRLFGHVAYAEHTEEFNKRFNS